MEGNPAREEGSGSSGSGQVVRRSLASGLRVAVKLKPEKRSPASQLSPVLGRGARTPGVGVDTCLTLRGRTSLNSMSEAPH